jgi:RNA polymerase sigma-70 factor (ECF subfamily)
VEPDDIEQHLSHIETAWSVVARARGSRDSGIAARQSLLLRYHRAVFRYVLGMVRSPQVAEELCQEFAVRFLRGDFDKADPQRGRFRDFLKTSLRHLVIDYWRNQKQQKQKGTVPLPDDLAEGASGGGASDAEFLRIWREELLTQAWKALARYEEETGSPYHTILRYKIDNSETRSARVAAVLSRRLGRPFSAASVRQNVHRARTKFAEVLLTAVTDSLQGDQNKDVEEELIELELLEYCRSALKKHD